MGFFRKFGNPETRPPTELELREDRNESFALVLRDYGLDSIRLKTKWYNQNGLHLFVRLFQCSSENWTALHARSDQIKKKLRILGIEVKEIFYSHSS